MARLAVLLSLPQPPTRQSLLKDAVRFGVVSVATEPLQDLHKWLEVEFHPLSLCKRVEATLKVIEDDNDEKSQLQQYLPALREITLVIKIITLGSGRSELRVIKVVRRKILMVFLSNPCNVEQNCCWCKSDLDKSGLGGPLDELQ